ncbi:protein GAMETE EXPRESSED 2 [Citrus sinensis]|uniref:Protein GAMETE EXPRESSED 2 n=1 Tax=Citrus sinensis TaxID=2711 RepID=A0ACB8I8Z6_CITSI|nr:protein GAMETE EXPRESSED 2 [Citrus sinensis]
MAVQSHLFVLISLLASTLSSASAAELASNHSPKFAFSWLDDNNTFQAGYTATIRIKVLGNFDSRGDASLGKSAFKPTLTVNGKIGNSSYTSGVLLETGEDTSNWRILFIPISVGLFNVIIKDDPFEVLDSSLHFKVEPGRLNPSVCVASWMGLINEFEAGNKARIMILPKDAFGNNVTSTSEELSSFNFTVSALYANGSALTPNITNMGLNEVGYIIIEFILMKAGNFSLHVEAGNQTLNGSPLPFKVNPGPVDVSNCVAKWKYEVAAWQIFSKMEIFIHQLDQYGNLVPGFYAFDADVVEKETNLSIPVADLQFVEVAPGVQLFSYTIEESGNFLLTISDEKHNKSVSNMPYTYTVFVGYCNGSSSVVNGSGLNDSVAGETAHFSVYLNDMFQYPYPVEVERLQVQIVREIDSSTVWPSISPTQIYNGDVNMTLSGVVKFTPKVAKLITHEVVVQLLDSYSNPVLSQQSRLKLEITSMNSSGFSSWMFVDNNDGSYSGHYLAMDVGTYEMCVSYDGTNFSLCPFLVNVYSSQYFPKAYDDKVSVWEDESIALDALANDYFAGNNASIIEFSKPVRGSLLQYGRMFRYTPFKDYIGNDSFSYTISDVNGNLATAAVNISVLSIPPQFVSFPSQLQATEDMISPRFGGFLGFEIRYSDMLENICVSLSARSGTVILSSMMMQFWQPMSSGLSVRIGDGDQMELIIEGSVEVINMALQSIQYLGNENFYGEDTIRVSARNKNGKNDLGVPVFVDPVNDPPFIQVPEYIVLKSDADESQIFDRETNKFNFSIGDPDAFNYPGGTSRFLVTFSMEVNDGLLVTSLPAELINSTELKLKTSFQWEPLQTYVTISKHFTVKASGVRFRGTVNDCNSIMQQLFYQSGEGDDVLKVKLNDMGHYGCRPDCTEKISLPLFAEATVNLIRRRPMSSVLAHTLGAGVVIEFFMVFFLGVLLLFFTCKCAFLLVNERRSRGNSERSTAQSYQKQTQQAKTNSPDDDTTYFTGCCSTSFMLAGQASNFRQR